MVINSKYTIPEPVLFNCMKHHAGYISEYIADFNPSGKRTKSFLKDLNTIGNSQMDLYTGNLSPLSISTQIFEFLKISNAGTGSSYLHWMEQAGYRYRILTVSDDSTWILLPGNKKDRYVHIHPGRFSRHSVRVRSETLKCAIAALVFAKRYERNADDLDFINMVRTGKLNLPPVRDIAPNRGIGKLIRLLSDKI